MAKDPRTSAPSPRLNRLLRDLPEEDYDRLLPDLEPVSLALGETVQNAGSTLRHIYFPTSGIVSLLYVTENGSSAEIAVVGAEGVVGIALFMGGQSTLNSAVVQGTGFAYRLNSRAVKAEFARGGQMQHLLLRYTQALLTQMTQTAVCYRHHNIHQQLCRWLLLSLDRLESDDVAMTQSLIANMLGVRREGVTEAVGKLEQEGLIRHRRGTITVTDRPRLEARVCECYAAVKREYDRLLDSK